MFARLVRSSSAQTLPTSISPPTKKSLSCMQCGRSWSCVLALLAMVVLVCGAVLVPFAVLELSTVSGPSASDGATPLAAISYQSKLGGGAMDGSPTINQWNPPTTKAHEPRKRTDDTSPTPKPTVPIVFPPHHKEIENPEPLKESKPIPLGIPPNSNITGWKAKAQSVKNGFIHAFTKYSEVCYGKDEYRPLSRQCFDWIGAGLTIIDSLSTMHVMGLMDEFNRARDWVSNNLHFEQDIMTSFFETTIRVLGGLVSAYDLSKEPIFLTKAEDVGQRLMPVFRTPTGIPHAIINLKTGASSALGWSGGSSLLAELGTCQMEFFALAKRSGKNEYATTAQKPIDVLGGSTPPIPGLYPIYVSPVNGQFTNGRIAWGAMGDSFYEYLLKMYLLTGKTHDQYKRMYIQSVDSMLEHLYSHTPSGVAYIADLEGGRKDHKMDHLVCFVPGMLALAVKQELVTGEKADKHMAAAKELMDTCILMYSSEPSGIGAEYSRFTPEMTPGHDASYKLRPETVESLFVMWRVTGDEKYREAGWTIWQNIEKHCRVENGYVSLRDVRSPEAKEDKMESFFLAETLKYLYLLFEDNSLIPIFPTNESSEYYVFNTECHPIKAWATWP